MPCFQIFSDNDFFFFFLHFCIRDRDRAFDIYFVSCQTGGDGCICYLEYRRDRQNLQFIGMKRVKELSLVQSVSSGANSVDDLTSSKYAIGFASTDFIIWNLITETKVLLSLSHFLPG